MQVIGGKEGMRRRHWKGGNGTRTEVRDGDEGRREEKRKWCVCGVRSVCE